MVSQPETGSDSPIGSDRDRGRDIMSGERVFSHCRATQINQTLINKVLNGVS